MGSKPKPLSLPLGYRYFWYDDIDSTNLEAFRKIAEGGLVDDQLAGSWICAKSQSGGRGTKGNQWISKTGNLYTSLLTRTACPSRDLAQISILAGLAAITAIEQFAPPNTQVGDLCLKWPNDILLNGKKVCGILVESRPAKQPGFFDVVIGSGLNIADHPDIDSLFRAGNLGQEGWECSRDDIFVALARSTRDWFTIWRDGRGFETLRLAWLERSCHIGHHMVIRVGDTDFEGRFSTISHEGALILIDESGLEKKISSGHINSIYQSATA